MHSYTPNRCWQWSYFGKIYNTAIIPLFIAVMLALSYTQEVWASSGAQQNTRLNTKISADETQKSYTSDIQFYDPFAPCDNDCSLSFFAGHSAAPMSMQDVLTNVIMPTEWDWGDSDIAGMYVSRPFMGYKDLFTLDAEIGMAKRWGAETETELWSAIFFRWRKFPWNHIVKTTIGASTGINYATGVSDYEKEKAATRDSGGARLLHFFSPELTLALPEQDNVELVFRFHHRSGVWGTFSGVHGGSHFGTVGLRFRF